MKFKIVSLVVSLISGLIVQSQKTVLTLNEAIASSLENNYDIRLTRSDSLLAALDLAYAKYALYPRINANAGMLFNTNNQKQVLADGTKRESNGIRSNNVNASLNLDWTLFDGFRMFIVKDRLGQLVELSELQIKAQVVNTVADVMRIYFDVVRQLQQLTAIDEQIQLSEERLKLAQFKFDVGTGAKPDVLQAQIDLNGFKSNRLRQEVNINKTKELLNQLMIMPAGYDYSIADTSIEFNAFLTLDSVQNGLTATNPELLIARQNMNLAELDLRLRRAERYPNLEFNSAYNFNRTDNKSVINPFQPLFNQNRGWNYGFTATIPIFNGYNNKRLIKAAELNIETQQLIYDRSAAFLQTSIMNAYKDYDLYRRTLTLEEENMLLVRENLFIARERYRLGISTFLEMREAQQSLADAANRLIEARYNTKVAEIELMRLRGEIVK